MKGLKLAKEGQHTCFYYNDDDDAFIAVGLLVISQNGEIN